MSELKQLQRQLKEISEEAHQMRLASCHRLAAELEKHALRLRQQIRTIQKEQGLVVGDKNAETEKTASNRFALWQRILLLFTGKVPLREENDVY